MAASNVQPQEDFKSRFNEIVLVSADILLAQTVPEFKPLSRETTPALDSVCVVGFVGPVIRGMFYVGMSGDGIRQLRADLYEDWIGELANQLAGRVKNRLSRHAISYDISPPITVRGERLSVAAAARIARGYVCSVGECWIWVLLDVLKVVEIKPADENEEPVIEGNLLIFDT